MEKNKTNLFVPFQKIDKEKRMVYGYVSTDTKDSQGEIVEKEAIKKAWSDYMKWANIREMHQPSAVGVTKEYMFDDKGTWVGAKIVDKDAWTKVKEGVYKGFSIGGRILKKIGDRIKEIVLYEISIVDRPANPECSFQVVKIDGDISKAKWTTAYINNLPDAAFAVIEPGGKKDDTGKTEPRRLRHLPHHNASVKRATENTSVDLPHLRNALARLPQLKLSDSLKKKAYNHLANHAKALLPSWKKEIKLYGLLIYEKDELEKLFESIEKQGQFHCQCLECGYTMWSDKHCADIRCPKCGGRMRRVERPGVGQKTIKVGDVIELIKSQSEIMRKTIKKKDLKKVDEDVKDENQETEEKKEVENEVENQEVEEKNTSEQNKENNQEEVNENENQEAEENQEVNENQEVEENQETENTEENQEVNEETSENEIKKDVKELAALAELASNLEYLIEAFKQNNKGQKSIPKMEQALNLLMQASKVEASEPAGKGEGIEETIRSEFKKIQEAIAPIAKVEKLEQEVSSLKERIKEIENTPKSDRPKASYVVEKGSLLNGGKEDYEKLTAKMKEILAKIDDAHIRATAMIGNTNPVKQAEIKKELDSLQEEYFKVKSQLDNIM